MLLYIKTHNKTGLKYLGHTKQDPSIYPGSGVRWKQHLRKHGNDVTTEVLVECETEAEIKRWGLYYSNLWNVVESEEWANLMPEEGQKGPGLPKGVVFSKEHIQKLAEKNRARAATGYNPFRGKKHRKESMTKRTETRRIRGIKPTFTGKGTRWFTNGKEDRMCFIAPAGFYPGRTKNRKENSNSTPT